MLMPLRGNRRRRFSHIQNSILRKGIIMLKYLNQELFKEELISDPATNYTDRCFTPPDFIEYDEEHPRPDKPFLKVREFSCENESDRKLNIRGILTKSGAKTFRVSSGDRNIGDDEDLFMLAIPFRGYLDQNDMPEWIRILKNRIVISTKYTIKVGDANYSKMLWLAVMVDKDKLPADGDASFTIHYFYPERTRKKGTSNPERFPTGKTVYVDRTVVYENGEFTMKPEEPRVIEGEPERIKHPFNLYQFPDKDCLRFDKPKKEFNKDSDRSYRRYEDRKYEGAPRTDRQGNNNRRGTGRFNNSKRK